MSQFFSSGLAIDIVLLVLLIEAAILARRGWKTGDVATLLLPAVLMMVALRAALTGAHWAWIAVPLTASFPIHLVDVRKRRNNPPPRDA